jgi:cell division protein FtsW (lipid II flippase)
MLTDSVGAQGMPKSYGVALAVLSILLIGQTLLTRRRGAASAAPTVADESRHKERYAAFRAAGMLAIGVVYVVALPWLGYVVSLALLIVATAWYQEKARRRWLFPTAIIGAGIFWVLFVKVLQISEPAGFWPSLL